MKRKRNTNKVLFLERSKLIIEFKAFSEVAQTNSLTIIFIFDANKRYQNKREIQYIL